MSCAPYHRPTRYTRKITIELTARARPFLRAERDSFPAMWKTMPANVSLKHLSAPKARTVRTFSIAEADTASAAVFASLSNASVSTTETMIMEAATSGIIAITTSVSLAVPANAIARPAMTPKSDCTVLPMPTPVITATSCAALAMKLPMAWTLLAGSSKEAMSWRIRESKAAVRSRRVRHCCMRPKKTCFPTSPQKTAMPSSTRARHHESTCASMRSAGST
mmetsp:Transcript_75368/g.232605  ORF Transcript_75368/g.232605 Transcript_75368/m.232605 type:complete len:222 (+) Transcript_75368:1352-2017(+)